MEDFLFNFFAAGAQNDGEDPSYEGCSMASSQPRVAGCELVDFDPTTRCATWEALKRALRAVGRLPAEVEARMIMSQTRAEKDGYYHPIYLKRSNRCGTGQRE